MTRRTRGRRCYTGRAHPDTEGTTGIAVEPMTCPPDAFNSGTDLVVLRPEQSHTGSWGIRPGVSAMGKPGDDAPLGWCVAQATLIDH